jgi:bifunctional non-homologous end joining protein LigD
VFDHPDFYFEVKFDGFCALAHIDGHCCQLVSRNGHVFKSWPYLAEETAHAVRAYSAVLDGEIVCLDADGCSRFYDLLFRREWPYCLAFDVLSNDGEDCARCRSYSASVGLRASCRGSNHDC